MALGQKLKRYLKERYKKAMGTSNGLAEKYANGMVKWLLKNKNYAEAIEVIKVDKDTLKFVKHPLPVPANASEEEILKMARKGANVGDFVIIRGKVFRRIRGGFREATVEDMAELIGSQI